jgi:hypothetical protein
MPATAGPRSSARGGRRRGAGRAPHSVPVCDLAGIARLFSRRSFRALGASRPEHVREVARSLISVTPEARGMSLGEAFDFALAIMTTQYRGEYVFKNLLVNRLVFGRHNARTASALLELRAGTSIADVVIFNGTSTAYEIKTDLDNLSRLPVQTQNYSRYFEQVFVVTTTRMAPRIVTAIPAHVGVLVLTSRGSLSHIRDASSEMNRLSSAALFGLLRRGEVLRILERTCGYEVDVPVAQIWHRTREMFAALPVDVAHREAVSELRERGMSAAPTATLLPHSLRALAYEVPLSGSATRRMHDRLSMPAVALMG